MSENDSYELARSFGYMTRNEVKLLKSLVMRIESDSPTLVNIGAGAGTSTLAMREVKLDANLISIDISKGGPLGGFEGETNAFNKARMTPPVQVLGKSHDLAAKWGVTWGAGEIDLIFIDDGHLEPEIRGDILGWRPHMKRSGVMVFHDYGSPRWPDVKNVVDELMSGYPFAGIADTLIAFVMSERKNLGENWFI